MEREAADIAEVGHVTVELEALDEALSGFLAALDLERRHRAEAPTRAVLLAPLVPARGREAGVGHRLHLRVGREVVADDSGVGEVALHPQAQGLDALDDQEGVERADGGADVAQQLHAGLEDRSEEHTSELQSLMRISYAVLRLKK